MKDYVVFDCETQLNYHQVEGGWSNVYGHGMSVAATWDSATDLYKLWGSNQREDLCKYLHGRLAVSYNGLLFDSVLLLGNDRILELNGITRNDKYWWINADLYVEMWRNILNLDRSDYPKILTKMKEQKFPKGVFGLDDVVYGTVGMKKLGNGSHAPDMYQNKMHVPLFEYVLQDVRVLKRLYQFVKQYKYLVTGSFDIVQFK